MTHMTSLTLNPRSRQVNKDLSDCHNLHRSVMRMVSAGEPLPQEKSRESTNTLFRLSNGGECPELLVQSDRLIEHRTLANDYVLQRRDVDLDAVLARLRAGSAMRYSLIAAPTHSSKFDEQGNRRQGRGKKHPIITAGSVSDWWDRRLPELGLAHRCDETARANPLVRIDNIPGPHGKRGGDIIRHRAWRIAGVATVRHLDALRPAVTGGVGPGKSYGMGLLTVLPL